MKLATIQFISWDKFYYADPKDLAVNRGDFVVVNTDFGEDLGKVVELKDLDGGRLPEDAISIVRIADSEDMKIMRDYDEEKEKTINYCHTIVKRCELEMKLIDCHFSFDGKRLTFAFVADGRVDFREAVKELTRHFQKNIRLHQLGVRDEAKIAGDIGSCGEGLCCQGHLKKLGSVTSELAEQQQVAHRGSERLSGICGRLKCCLAYEKDLYDELASKLPPIGTRVRTDHGKGEIVGWHTLRSSVDVRLDSEKEGDRPTFVEITIKDKKDKKEK